MAGPGRPRVDGERAGSWRVTGVWSHLSSSDEPDDPANDAQEQRFAAAVDLAERAGLRPEVRHLANSAAAILRPSSRHDLVRCGLACYGLDPAPGHTPDLGLVPAMTARAALALVKRVEAGAAVSYGRTWTAPRATTLGLVPVGYADGLLRAASARAEALVAGARRPVRGVICMDQLVVDLGADDTTTAEAGDPVVLFGTGADGAPTAQDWAEAAGTISYEVVTRVGGRMVRRHTDSRPEPAPALVAGATREPRPPRRRPGRRRARRRHRRRRRPPQPHHRPPRPRLDPPREPALAGDHRRGRRRRAAARGGRRGRPRPRPAARLTVVFVHGFALTLDCWHFQRAAYRGLVRAVYYDQRSHGRSGRSSREHATIDQLGLDLAAVLDVVAPDEPVVLVGHSMGGMTVVALAEQHPELFGDRVVGVGLISTTAGGLDPSKMLLPFLPARLTSELTGRLVRTLAVGHRLVDGVRRAGHSIAQVSTDLFAFGDEVPQAYVDFADSMLSSTPFEVVAEFFPSFRGLDKFDAVEVMSRVPTTIICGTADRLTSISHSRVLHERIAGSVLIECEGAGHLVVMERHGQVDAALDQLLTAAAERSRTR